MAALCNALAPRLALAPREVESRIAFVMSGGTEGVLSPHMTVFARSPRSRPRKRARRGPGERGHSPYPRVPPEEIGRDAQIGETMKAVETAMSDARIDAVSDVHFVQIKCPLLTSERVQDALAHGKTTVTASGLRVNGLFPRRFRTRRRKALGEIGADVGEDRRWRIGTFTLRSPPVRRASNSCTMSSFWSATRDFSAAPSGLAMR